MTARRKKKDPEPAMNRLLATLVAFACLCVPPPGSLAEDLHGPGLAHGGGATLDRKCPDNGGYSQTVFIIPRVYISYTGASDCWSEIRYVEIPIDFIDLQQVAKEEGDAYTQKIMSHGDLADFFTWLLESGKYAMPGDALSGILGYVQRKDHAGLYRLFREYGKMERGERRY